MNDINELNKIKLGCDIVENNKIKLNDNLIAKILHPEEIKILNTFLSKKRKIEFIAGRWAVKEAIFKATNVSIAFNKINIFYINNIPSVNLNNYYVTISISHESKYTIANCIAIKI